MSELVSNKSTNYSSTQTKFRNQSNEPQSIDNLPNETKSQNYTENKPFGRVNSNRQSIVKNESGLWSNASISHSESSMYTITLISNNQTAGPLGIHVIPTFDSISQRDTGLTIQRIEPGGRVYRDGRLQVGDRIIEINRKNLIGLSFIRCQEILRECINQSNLTHNGLLEFKIYRPGNHFDLERSEHVQTQKEDNSCKKENNCGFMPNSINLGALNTKKMGTKINVKLVKGPEGLGFKLSARDFCNPGEFSPIYIKNILPVGAALKDGRLQRGDRLLEVNSIDMTQKTLHEAVNILRDMDLGDPVDIVVSRQVLESDAKLDSENCSEKKHETAESKLESSSNNKDQNPNRLKFNFKIKVGSDSLGVSVLGKSKRLEESENLIDLGIYVKAIIDGGAVCRDGRIKLNDQIISINGSSLLGKSNDDAMNILKDAMHREIEPGIVEIAVSRKINSQSKPAKRDESLSPNKNSYRANKHSNRKSDEYADTEQFSRFNRDAPSRRSVSEKRLKTDMNNGYATFGKHVRNQSLNDQNPKRSSTWQIIQGQNISTQTLGRPAKLINCGRQSDYLVPQNVKSASMESIPISQYSKNVHESKYLINNKIEVLNPIKIDITSSKVGDIEDDNLNINRLNPKNRSFLTAIDKSKEKLDKTTEESSEFTESSESSKIDMSKMEKAVIKKSSESFRHKSLIGKFQNLLKSTYSKKNQHLKCDKQNLNTKSNEKSFKKLNNPIENQNSKELKSVEKLIVKNNSDNFLLENDTLYKQYIPNKNQSCFVSNSAQTLNDIQPNFKSNFANRESVYYQSIDNSKEYIQEQKKLLREKQKKILEQQQKYYQENDRQPRCVTRNASMFQQSRPLQEPNNEKIHLSAPFNASPKCNLVSDLIREPDFSQRYFPETASTTSSIVSTSSAYTTSSFASDQQNHQILSSHNDFQNFSHITNITQV